ncbi:MFS transporter [Microlunatus ginsengisoli]|uniref:MFS transporter n=1 Tax=Microlunatus ginsengisoli TaxID=363863 RepID=A0ABP7A667_9ACTN
MPSVALGTGAGAYVRLLRHGPALRPFLAANLARLPISVGPLGMLLLVEQSRGSYGLAGLVTGAYAIGVAVGSPLWGRAMDRVGQRRVLVPTSLVCAALIVVLALCTRGGVPGPGLVALAAVAGLTYPPTNPALRAAWRVIFPDPADRRVAFALDATSVELLFVGGPLLLSALLVLTPPVVPLLVTAGCMAVGGLLFCATAASAALSGGRIQRPPAAPTGRNGQARTALTVPGVASILLVMVALSIGFGQLDASMAATAAELLGGPQRLGVLFTAIAGGSALGGLIYGSRTWPFREQQAVPVLLGAFAVFLALISVLLRLQLTTLWVLLPVLFLTGLTVAPTLVMQQALLDQVTPLHRLNEAQAFLGSANTTGAAIGTAIAGFLIDLSGVVASFGGAATFAACAAVVALSSRRRLPGPVVPSVPAPPVQVASTSAEPVACPAECG